MFINHIFAKTSSLPEIGPGFYEYVIAGNGIFVRARRPELEAMFFIQRCEIKGLQNLEPYFKIQERVPRTFVRDALLRSVEALPNEALFWFVFGNSWKLVMPRQVRSKTSVRPTDPYDGFGAVALIDLHTHNTMPPFFSQTDNRDETGFRIYAVIGSIDVHSKNPPAIRARVGVYGHYWNIPASWVFALTPFLREAEATLEAYDN